MGGKGERMTADVADYPILRARAATEPGSLSGQNLRLLADSVDLRLGRAEVGEGPVQVPDDAFAVQPASSGAP
jgi:hypothetical protein